MIASPIVPAAAPRRRLPTALWCVLLLAVPLLLHPTSAAASTTPERQWARAIVRLLNVERALHGLPPLTVRSRLVSSAHAHNLRMAAADTMSHRLPHEAALPTRVSRTGYRWHYVGENIGWNSDVSRGGVLLLERLMYGEKPPNDGHRLNILSGDYRNIGVDVYVDRTHHKVWLTEDFGAH